MKQVCKYGLTFVLASFFLVSFLTISAELTNDDKRKQSLTIVALAPHIVELLYDIGAGQQIIGVGSYADFPRQAESLPVVGDHANLHIEKIVQMQPDVIIAWRSGNPMADIERLRQFGLNVEMSNPTRLQDIGREIRWLGDLTGRRPAAQLKSESFEKRLHQLQQKYRDTVGISGFFEIWSNPLQTMTGKAWPQQHLELCNVKNIIKYSGNDYPTISMELVLTHNPQIIIQPESSNTNTTTRFDWSRFPELLAVKNGFMFKPNADKLYRMTTRVLDEIDVLCEQVSQARAHYH